MILIEQIKQGKLWSFHGGIHPAENKAQSNVSPILPVAIPTELVLPLKQHIGSAGRVIVNIGEQVKKGQPLTITDSHHCCPIHAPTSGEVIGIEQRTICHPSGLTDQCIILRPDLQDTWGEKHHLVDFLNQTPERLIEHIRQMGIAGLGGAGFPTARKTLSGLGRTQILIINAAECEPYITADDRLMQEHAAEIIQGIEVLQHILQPKVTVIAIEDNKPAAITALNKATNENILVRVIPTKYPSGGEKQLIQIITGHELPANQIPADIGILVQNVATVFAVKKAVIDGEPLIQRVVTLTGSTLLHQANRWTLLGTKLSFLLAKHGHLADKKLNRLIVGGPMMGFSAPHAEVPVSKMTNCLLLPSAKEISPSNAEMSCIRCGACAEACPASLLPQQLYWYAKQRETDQCQKYNLFDCIECGVCAYVCPSEIPLVQYYRQAKANIRYQHAEQQASEIAKERFEAKKLRLEHEKSARESKHKEAAALRQHKMIQENGQDAVAAAIARVKAKQQATQQLDNVSIEEKHRLREERKQQARKNRQAQPSSPELTNPIKAKPTESAAEDPKKAAVAAAIARAKARKAAQAQPSSLELTDPIKAKPTESAAEDPKKAAGAAAIARAKARKAAQQQVKNQDQPEDK